MDRRTSRFFLAALASTSLVAVATLGLSPTAAKAALVYDNGTFATDVNYFNTSDFIAADDFTLASTQTFNSIRFWTLGQSAGLATDFSGTLTWAVRSNNNGIPGAVLFGGTTSDVAVTDTGVSWNNFSHLEIAQHDFVVPEVTLDEGTYWLSLLENAPSTQGDGTPIFWLNTASLTGNRLKLDADLVNPSRWNVTNNNFDLAFQLNDVVTVPEPGTLALTLPALGILGAVFMARPRRR